MECASGREMEAGKWLEREPAERWLEEQKVASRPKETDQDEKWVKYQQRKERQSITSDATHKG
eukprot:1389466-Amphidinium_carterae.1